jgi:hypothetical protein
MGTCVCPSDLGEALGTDTFSFTDHDVLETVLNEHLNTIRVINRYVATTDTFH